MGKLSDQEGSSKRYNFWLSEGDNPSLFALHCETVRSRPRSLLESPLRFV